MLNPGPLPAAVVAPDVPEDALLVQGGAQDPVAFSAISIPVTAGAVARTLSVRTADGGGTLPGSSLIACPLSDAQFAEAQGGPIGDAPTYHCGDSPSVQIGADGRTFSFDATALVLDDSVAVALVPGDGTSRIVLEAPGLGALRFASSSPAPPLTVAPSPAVSAPTAVESTTSAATAPITSGSATASVAPRSPSDAVVSVPAGSQQAGGSGARPSFAANVVSTVVPPKEGVAVVVVVFAIVAAGYSWRRAGSSLVAVGPKGMKPR